MEFPDSNLERRWAREVFVICKMRDCG